MRRNPCPKARDIFAATNATKMHFGNATETAILRYSLLHQYSCKQEPISKTCKHEAKGGFMKRFLITAVAAIAVASPAMARDGSGYIGAEAGLMIPRDSGPSGNVDRRFPGGPWVDFLDINHKLGF